MRTAAPELRPRGRGVAPEQGPEPTDDAFPARPGHPSLQPGERLLGHVDTKERCQPLPAVARSDVQLEEVVALGEVGADSVVVLAPLARPEVPVDREPFALV